MEQTLIIGKLGNQPFTIDDPDVSRRHATLYYDTETGALSLCDNNSTNGTYLYDGRTFTRIQPGVRVKVSPDTMMRLGPQTRFHVRKVLPPAFATGGKPKKPEPPKAVNIAHLRQISETYISTKQDLDGKTTTLNGLRGLSLVFTVLASALSGVAADLFGLSNMQVAIISFIVLVILVVSLQMIISNRLKKVALKKEENERTYATKYCCPKCAFSFRGKYYENIIAGHKCPNCKCEYTE